MRTSELIWPLLPWLVANGALLVPTTLLWKRLRLRSPRIDGLVFVFLFLFVTTGSMMLLALASALRPGPAFAATVGPAVLLGAACRRELRSTFRAVRRRATSFVREGGGLGPTEGLFVLLLLAVAVRIGAHVWLLPPYVRDTLSYHLPKVAEWVRNGSLVVFATPVDRTFWPGGFELFQTWFVLFPHHDFLIELACVFSWVFACAGVWTLGRCVGLSGRAALAAATIYGLTPAPLQHATTSKNDLQIAALYLFLLALILDVRGRRLRPWRRLLLIAMASALALGTKPTIVFLLPGLVVALWWVLRRRSRTDGAVASRPSLGLPLVGVLLGVAGLLAGYWFLRNALVFGNPFYPAEPRLFGEYLFGTHSGGRERQGVVFSPGALVRNLHAVATERIFDRNPFHFSQTDMTGWGWFAFACGWPTLGLGLALSARIRWLAVIFGVSLLSLFASVVSDPWYLRFAQWFPALFALSFCLVLGRLRWRPARSGLAVTALACLVLNVVGTLDIGGLTPSTWARMARLPVAERSTAALGLFVGRRFHDVLERIPVEEPIGYNTNYNGFVYPLYDADFSRDVRYVPLDAESDVVGTMRGLGVAWLFASLPPPEARAALEGAVRRGELQRVAEELYVLPR